MIQRLKRGLASLLVALMLISMLPAALAAEPDGEIVSSEQVAEALGRLYYFQNIADTEQIAVPNEEGVYVLILRQDTEFPCEVVLYNPAIEDEDGAYFSVIFDNGTDSVEVAGCTFLPQLSGESGSKDSDADPYSLLPLKEHAFAVDLTGYIGDELKAVKLEDVLTDPNNGSPISYYSEGQTVVWGKKDNTDRFTVAKGSTTIDLSEIAASTSSSSVRLELIVGSGDQFDPDNIRCIVTATVTDPKELLAFSVITGDAHETINSPSVRNWPDDDGSIKEVYYLNPNLSIWDTDVVKLGLDFRADSTSVTSGLTANVYSGYYDDVGTIPADAENITSQIWGSLASGYEANYDQNTAEQPPMFTVVLKRGETAIYTIPFGVFISWLNPYSLLDFAVYADNGDELTTTAFFPVRYHPSDSNEYKYEYVASIVKSDLETASNAALVMSFRPGYSSVTDGLTVTVTAEGHDVTSNMWWDGNSLRPAGHTGNYTLDPEDSIRFQVTLADSIHSRTLDFIVKLNPSETSVYCDYPLYLQGEDGKRTSVSSHYDTMERDDNDPNRITYTFSLNGIYPETGIYYLNLLLSDSAPGSHGSNGIDSVDRAVLGDYTSETDIKAQTDIKTKLFESVTSYTANSGYAADFKNGPVTFTVLDINGDIHHVKVVLTPYVPVPNASTYLNMFNAKGDSSSYNAYIVDSTNDSYFSKGYQTIFLLDNGSPVTASKIKPLFTTSNGATIYLGTGKYSGTVQVSGQSEVDFESGKPLAYSAAAENKYNLANYWVTFITQQEDAKLFVNAASNSAHKEDGIAVREVNFTSQSSYHDILFANIGKEDLEGLSVSLNENPLIQLDEYWSIQSDGVKKLAGFTTTNKWHDVVNEDGSTSMEYTSNGDLPNLAKVRLLPVLDENGMVQSGVIDTMLTISSDNGDSESVRLTGLSGQLRITTEEMRSGVKYVPYSQLIQTNALRGAGNVIFELVQEDGPLPNGLELYPDGEIYGAPQAAGEWTFTVMAYFDGHKDAAVTQAFTITIADNTDENVYMSSDETSSTGGSYLVQLPIGHNTGNYHYVLTERGDQKFISYGEFSEFVKLWLDGQPLTPGEDYDAESGSTVITIWGETIGNNDDGNSHTISAEFRTGEGERSGDLKKTSQNFVIDLGSAPGTPGTPSVPSPGSTPGSGNNSNTQKPDNSDKPTTAIPNTTPESSSIPFDDVRSSDWFHDDVKWAYDQGLMIGVSDRLFAPTDVITQATVVTLLARMSNVDLSRYNGIIEEGIESGQWYTNAAIWAKRAGLLPDNEPFKGTEPIARADMAIMLVKYLRSLGFDTSMPKNPISFADADLMSEADNNAFQVLYQYGIFKGVGGLRMDPAGFTTRSQFAALIHRISIFVQAKNNL